MFLVNAYGAPTCGMIFKRDSFIKSGGFDQQYTPALDWVFMIFFSQRYKVLRLKKVVANYIWGDNSQLDARAQGKYIIQRKQILKSLAKQDKLLNILFNCFSRDFEKMMDEPIYYYIKHSFIYNVIHRIYSCKLYG
jgi:hypothetical protein